MRSSNISPRILIVSLASLAILSGIIWLTNRPDRELDEVTALQERIKAGVIAFDFSNLEDVEVVIENFFDEIPTIVSISIWNPCSTQPTHEQRDGILYMTRDYLPRSDFVVRLYYNGFNRASLTAEFPYG